VKLFQSGLAMVVASVVSPWGAQAASILYDQNFEHPVGFVNEAGDVNSDRSINQLYGSQPAGFVFAQTNTVETLFLHGTEAFGHGYSDPSGIGGNYAIGMLSNVEEDWLGLAFHVGGNTFLNVGLDVSSIDLSSFGGTFVRCGAVPLFAFTLYDNPTGAIGLGSGAVLASAEGYGTASQRDVFDWTHLMLALDASGSTNGNVILRIDLVSGGYAAMDNFRIASSDTAGDVGPVAVPEPASLLLLCAGGIGALARARRRVNSQGL
jgi:hypothetical protein